MASQEIMDLIEQVKELPRDITATSAATYKQNLLEYLERQLDKVKEIEAEQQGIELGKKIAREEG